MKNSATINIFIVTFTVGLFVLLNSCSTGSENNNSSNSATAETPPTKYYLLVFAINITNFEPVVLKNCVEYDPKKDNYLESEVASFSKHQRCERSKSSMTWTCTDNKKIVSKIILMKDLKECREFPQKSASDMKKLFAK